MWVLILFGQIFRVPEVIHITCNMGSQGLPDMYALSPRPCGPLASGIHIRQIRPAQVTTYTYILYCILTNIKHNSIISDLTTLPCFQVLHL